MLSGWGGAEAQSFLCTCVLAPAWKAAPQAGELWKEVWQGQSAERKGIPLPLCVTTTPRGQRGSGKLYPKPSKRGGSLYFFAGSEEFQVTCLCWFSMVPKNLLRLTSNVYSNLTSTPLSAGHTKLVWPSPDAAQHICFHAQVPLLRGSPTPAPPASQTSQCLSCGKSQLQRPLF